MCKKMIVSLMAIMMFLCITPKQVFAEESASANQQALQIEKIPSIDPNVAKMRVSNSTETILVEFNEITQEFKVNGITFKPTWWPGNPNPQPGTEDWLFQHYSPNLGSSAPKSTVSACLVAIGIDLSKAAVKAFFESGKWTLSRFVSYFGIALAESYATCLIGKGITD